MIIQLNAVSKYHCSRKMLITFDWFILTKNGIHSVTPDANMDPAVYNTILNFCPVLIYCWNYLKKIYRNAHNLRLVHFCKNGLHRVTRDVNTHPTVYNMIVNFCGWSSEEEPKSHCNHKYQWNEDRLKLGQRKYYQSGLYC